MVKVSFKTNQQQRIISGLRETFIKRYIVARTSKTGRTERRENFWNEMQFRGPEDRNRHKSRIKRSEQVRLVHVEDINRNIPTTLR